MLWNDPQALSLETIRTPQGDENVQSSQEILDFVETIYTPQGDENEVTA